MLVPPTDLIAGVAVEVATTGFTYIKTDLEAVNGQAGSLGLRLIEFEDVVPGTATVRTFHAVVAFDASGLMVAATHLAAKPCPPFCNEKLAMSAVHFV